MMQIIANGLITGLTIVVLALAFVVVYLPTRVFHMALGGVYAVVPFIAWTCLQGGWPWYLAIIVAILTGVLISFACERLNHHPLELKGASSGAHLVSSLGIYIIIVQIVALIWGNESKFFRTGIGAVIGIGTMRLTQTQAIAAGVSVVAIALFYFWLQFSNLGLQFRAMADNPKEFALRGYNVQQLRLIAFGISGFLGSISALLVAYDVGFDTNTGLVAVLLAVVAVLIGGKQSFWGPILGGILLGLIRAQVVWLLSARWQDAVTFLLLAFFLFLRPNGLLGQKGRVESEMGSG
jgi:branched-chain amino acid transport system permease protein